MPSTLDLQQSSYSDTGSLCVYAGTSPANKALECIDLILAEFRNLKEVLLSDEELTFAPKIS